MPVSQYRGVSWHPQHQKWRVRLTVNGSTRTMGFFALGKEKLAAMFYDAVAQRHHRKEHLLNFSKKQWHPCQGGEMDMPKKSGWEFRVGLNGHGQIKGVSQPKMIIYWRSPSGNMFRSLKSARASVNHLPDSSASTSESEAGEEEVEEIEEPPPLLRYRCPHKKETWLRPHVVTHRTSPSDNTPLLSLAILDDKRIEHRFDVSVRESALENAGRGAFITYRGASGGSGVVPTEFKLPPHQFLELGT